MSISQVTAFDKVVEVEFPDIEGFKVKIAYPSRERLIKIRNQSLKISFNKVTRQKEETVDNDQFLANYSRSVIKGWTGLTYKGLADLIPVEESKVSDMKAEIAYTEEDAEFLLKNAPKFDQFITEAVSDFQNLQAKKQETATKN